MERQEQLKEEIVRRLTEAGTDMELTDLLRDLSTYDEIEIKKAIWPLLYEGTIEMTPQRKIRVAPVGVNR